MKDGQNTAFFSVVIVSCNKYGALKRVVKAVRADYPNCELILADDHSTDKTMAWIKAEDPFDKVWSTTEDNGYALNHARNQGIELANGLIVALLDADVVPEPGFFEAHRAAMGYSEQVVSVGFTDRYNRTGTKMLMPDHRRKHIAFHPNRDIIGARWCDAYGGNIVFDKRMWVKLGGFDEDYDGAWGCEDLDFAFRAHRAGWAFAVHKGAVGRHLEHQRSKSLSGTDNMRNQRLFYKKHGLALTPAAVN